MGQHISPINIGMIFYTFDRNNAILKDVSSVGPELSMSLKIINSFTKIINMLARLYFINFKNISNDHYLKRLSHPQMERLNKNLALVVIGQKLNESPEY